VLEVLYHHAKLGGVRISPAAGVAKNVEFLLHGQVTIIFVVSVGFSVYLFMQSFSQPSLI